MHACLCGERGDSFGMAERNREASRGEYEAVALEQADQLQEPGLVLAEMRAALAANVEGSDRRGHDETMQLLEARFALLIDVHMGEPGAPVR